MNKSILNVGFMITTVPLLCFSPASAEELLTFDSSALFGSSNKNIDLSAFNVENTVPVGVYVLGVGLNDQYLGQTNIRFWQPDLKKPAVLCVDQALLEKIGLKNDVRSKLSQKPCVSLSDISPDAKYSYDDANQALSLTIPLALLVERPVGYISPRLFDQGVTAGYLTYNYNHYGNNNQSINTDSNYLGLTGGINIAGFNYRHMGSFESSNNRLTHYVSSLNVLSRDITALNSRLSLGDFTTNAYYMSSYLIRGVELSNDSSMRPWSVQSYAPTISGVANSNALVSIFQNGQKIYERTVPVGPFDIRDLTTLATNGDLTVQVTEQSGQKHSFIVPMQGMTNLVRVGQFNYNFALGRYKLERKVLDENLAQGTLEYGISNNFTLHGGSTLSNHYQGYLLGGGVNSLFGGMTFDVEQGNADLDGTKKNGQKYKLTYRYSFMPLNLSLNVSTQQLTQGYISFANTVSLLNSNQLTQDEVDNFYLTYRLKAQTSITLRQQFKAGWGALYLTGTRSQYWNDQQSYNQYTLGYSNHYKKLNYSINVAQTQTVSSEANRSIYASLSFPLSWKDKNTNVNNTLQHSNTTDMFATGLSGTAGEQNQMTYALNASRDDTQRQSTINASMNYLLPQTNVGFTVAKANSQRQYGVSLQGGVVAHPYGVTLTNNLSDTFTIIHAQDAVGAEVVNAWGVRLDRFGNAIYPVVDPYHINTLSINSKDLPLDVVIENNQSQVIPRRYSSTLLTFDTKKTSNILLNVHTAKQEQIPMGVEVKTKDNTTVAVMGQSNQLFVESEQSLKQPLTLRWGVVNQQVCVIPASDTKVNKASSKKQFQVIDVVCQ
ncbi:fimbria/pilus outer membrane usher protein [Acinetobacter rathckeae]|uniref:fimbria/pilus outer membrane usher protein n=1 Tax=Acinetobacter rathckeae TaxID=2605272 RepID=UPI0018A29927|nr:fimbria/pilus outer membrane usher protein [Acinetobacter rathckeae]MBF7696144.1 fimbrial biogenesis outer membrane usher protein [Acinetobacter rathckeae]